jgi:hypothetical protein
MQLDDLTLNILLVLQLVKLRRSPTVDDILKKYLEHRIKKDNKSVIYVMNSGLFPIFVTSELVTLCNSLLEL